MTGEEGPRICPICKYPGTREHCRLCEPGQKARGPGFPPFALLRGGLAYGKATFHLLIHPVYLGKIKMAVALNLVLSLAFYLLGIFVLHPWMSAFLENLPGFLVWIPVGWGSILLALLLALLLFTVPMSLFLNPVLDRLSLLAEEQALGWTPPGAGEDFWSDIWDSLDTGARIFLMDLLVLLLALLLGPLWIGLPLGFLAGCFLAGFAWMDYPMTRRRLSFSAKWKAARRHWAGLCGFGFLFLLGCLVPFLAQLLAGPAAATGASRLFFDFEIPEADLEPDPV